MPDPTQIPCQTVLPFKLKHIKMETTIRKLISETISIIKININKQKLSEKKWPVMGTFLIIILGVLKWTSQKTAYKMIISFASKIGSIKNTWRMTVDVIKPKAYSPTRGWRIIATSLKAVVFWSAEKVIIQASLENIHRVSRIWLTKLIERSKLRAEIKLASIQPSNTKWT